MLIKRGDAEFISVINPKEFSDEDTQNKIETIKQELSNIDEPKPEDEKDK